MVEEKKKNEGEDGEGFIGEDEAVMSEEEEAKIKERLKQLGYL
tara:strand:+ start:9346 stop:9474 length:129 start_codon:yes stop_codon:yes gene_type:complete